RQLGEQPLLALLDLLLGLLGMLAQLVGEALLALLDALQQGSPPQFQLGLGGERGDGGRELGLGGKRGDGGRELGLGGELGDGSLELILGGERGELGLGGERGDGGLERLLALPRQLLFELPAEQPESVLQLATRYRSRHIGEVHHHYTSPRSKAR